MSNDVYNYFRIIFTAFAGGILFLILLYLSVRLSATAFFRAKRQVEQQDKKQHKPKP